MSVRKGGKEMNEFVSEVSVRAVEVKEGDES